MLQMVDSSPSQVVPGWLYFASVLFTFLGICVTAYFTYLGSKNSKAAKTHAEQAAKDTADINDAVNHRHQDAPRLYDAVLDLVAWKSKWDSLPPELSSDGSLVNTLDTITGQIHHLDAKIDVFGRELIRHVEWEEKIKYPSFQQDVQEAVEKIVHPDPSRKVT